MARALSVRGARWCTLLSGAGVPFARLRRVTTSGVGDRPIPLRVVSAKLSKNWEMEGAWHWEKLPP